MLYASVHIQETYAEAFGMSVARLVVTAGDSYWLQMAVNEVVGDGSSIIGCDVEAGLERLLSCEQTADGRVGASLLFFAFSSQKLEAALVRRVGQCVMTCPTTAVFDGLLESHAMHGVEVKQLKLGSKLRYFGDGYQKSKVLGTSSTGRPRRYWRIPVMEGEFVVESEVGCIRGVAGGNLLFCGSSPMRTLQAARRAVEAIAQVEGVITPFPGGVARSGSKVGSRYQGLVASTHAAYCPTLRSRVKSKLPEGASCVYEVVIDGLSLEAVRWAMKAGIDAACQEPSDLVAISAGNYGGKLGKYRLDLKEILNEEPSSQQTSWIAIEEVKPKTARHAWHAEEGYTLTLKPGCHWEDVATLRPEVIGGLSPQAVASQLGHAFDMQGCPGEVLTLRGLPALAHLGAGMTSGKLVVHGQAGQGLGVGMTGGEIHLYGQAGDFVGGSLPGETQGMNGGVIVVHGDAGDYAGYRMRRGLLVVTGRVGKSPGYRMLAGTVVVGRGKLDFPGLEMQRGTVVCLDADAEVQTEASFQQETVLPASNMVIIRLLLRQLGALGVDVSQAMHQGLWRLSSGDALEKNKGELWQWLGRLEEEATAKQGVK